MFTSREGRGIAGYQNRGILQNSLDTATLPPIPNNAKWHAKLWLKLTRKAVEECEQLFKDDYENFMIYLLMNFTFPTHCSGEAYLGSFYTA